MQDWHRRLIFNIFALFYLASLPFLIILSLGYSFDLQNSEIANSLSINLDTTPRGAKVLIGQEEFTTPTDLQVSVGKSFEMEVIRKDFLSEKFALWSPKEGNSSVRFNDIWLLPQKPYLETNSIDTKILSILSEQLVLVEKSQEYFLQAYSFNGPGGNLIPISDQNEIELDNSKWESLLDNAFWHRDKNLLLFQNSLSQWSFFDLTTLPFKIEVTANFNLERILLLDQESNLWSLNKDTLNYEFLDTGFQGLAFTQFPDQIWFLQDDNIYRIPFGTNIENGFLKQNSNLYWDYFELSDWSLSQEFDPFFDFKVSGVFLGWAFKIGDNLIYMPDVDRQLWQIIDRNVSFFGVEQNSLFWLDEFGRLNSLNLLLNLQKSFGRINNFDSGIEYNIAYYTTWKRIFIYTPSKVTSIWYDVANANSSVQKYFEKVWVDSSQCFPTIIANYQFCVKNSKMEIYQNNSISW